MAWFRGEVCAASGGRASHMRARRQASHTPLPQRRRHQYSRTAVARAAKASVAAARERGGKTAAESVAGWTPTRARCSPLICLRAPNGHCSAPTKHTKFTPVCRTPVHCTSGKVLAPARPSLPPERQQQSEGWERDARQCIPGTHRTRPVRTPLPVPGHHLVVDVYRLCCQWRRLRASLPVSPPPRLESSQNSLRKPSILNFVCGNLIKT